MAALHLIFRSLAAILSFPRVAGLLAFIISTSALAIDFVHPGILNSQSSLQSLRHAYQESRIPTSALKTLSDSQFASLQRPHTPFSTVYVESHVGNKYERALRGDAHAARATALMWVLTGKDQYLNKSKDILNDWASAFNAIEVTKGWQGQAYLEAAWALPIWISAADIIRYFDNGSSNWSAQNIKKFDRFVKKLHALSSQAKKQNNWGASATLSEIAVGVYTEDEAIFNNGVKWFKHYLTTLSDSNGALTSDYLRDTWHPQYTLVAWMQTAEIAWHQGVDLYSLKLDDERSPRLAIVLEHFSQLFLGVQQNPEGLKKGNYKNAHLDRPGYQLAYNHYLVRQNLAANLPHLQDMHEKWYPGGFMGLFMSWDGVTHTH